VSLAAALRSRGFDAVAAQEARLKGVSDDEQMSYAVQSGRALVTSNVRHFLGIVQQLHAEGREHPGVILVTRPMAVGEMLQGFARLLDSVSAEEMRNRVAFLSDFVASE